MEGLGGWFGEKAKLLRQKAPFSSTTGHSGRTKEEKEKEKERCFLENGSGLLEFLISSCKGIKFRCNPIRSFSVEEINRATNYFKHPQFCSSKRFEWYKGTLDDRPVLIKKYKHTESYKLERTYRDIALSSQMSNHKNALKLLGCCLELSEPALVFEDAENRFLDERGGISFRNNLSSLSWKTRLKVAKDIANVITYLHTAFPRPIIHMMIQPSSISLDNKNIPKLCNFDDSLPIPEGKTNARIELKDHPEYRDFVGCCSPTFELDVEFVDPDYVKTSLVTEHYDVYSFGVVLIVLLTGQKAFECKRATERIPSYAEDLVQKRPYSEIVDPKILEDEGEINIEERNLQLQAFLNLSLSCVKEKREERPLMIDVAKELFKIERITRYSLGESSHPN